MPVRWYGVMMALAFLAGLWTATRRARLANVSGEIIADVTMWLMGGSIVGVAVLIELAFLHGRDQFSRWPLHSVLCYD